MLLCLSTEETDNGRRSASAAEKPIHRAPWNKGKLVGAKPPLRPSHVLSIRTKLQMEGRERDLAPFVNLVIEVDGALEIASNLGVQRLTRVRCQPICLMI
jgi:hypothetical protein